MFLLHSNLTHNCWQIIPSLGISAKHLPTVAITRKPSKINQQAFMFEIDVGQWVYFEKEKLPFCSVVLFPKMDSGM